MSYDDLQRWKDKYFESLERQECLEHRWNTQIDLLRRGLVRSSLAVEGGDKVVDRCMKELREILRHDDMDADLAALIPRLEKAVLDSEQHRKQRSLQNIEALSELAQQLLELDMPRELRRSLKRFVRNIDKRAQQSRGIPILLSELSRLQRQALAESRSGSEESRLGFLQRLFGGKDRGASEQSSGAMSLEEPACQLVPESLTNALFEPASGPLPVNEPDVKPEPGTPFPLQFTVATTEQTEPPGVVELPERDEISRTVCLDSQALSSDTLVQEAPLADASQKGPIKMPAPMNNQEEEVDDTAYALPPMPEPGYSTVAPHIEASLIHLLDELHLPFSHQPQAAALRTRINGSLNWYELVPLLDDLAMLALSLTNDGQRDFEEYLQQLNRRLESFLGYLDDAHTGYTGVLCDTRGLDQSLREQISNLQASMQQTADLESLKQAVDNRLNSLLETLDEHQRKQVKHEREITARLQTLMERVNSIERDAKAFQMNLKDQRQKALTDPLTGLPNRAAFSERLELEIVRHHQDSGELLLALLDLDHFKRINNDFGRLAGDKVLKIIADELSKCLRQTDFIARIDGEKFVILLPSTPLEAGRQLIEHLRAAVSACPFHFKGEPLSITCSAGLIVLSDGETGSVAFERADQALYLAKHGGRDRLEVA